MSDIVRANLDRMLLQGKNYGDRTKNALKTSILSQFEQSPSCFEVKRGRTFLKALITDNSSGASGEKVDDSKSIVLKPGELLTIGDIFEWLDSKWICTKSEQFSDIYYKGTIQKCNNSLKFYTKDANQNSILKEVPCVVSDRIVITEKDNRNMTLPEGTILVTVPNNVDTLTIYKGQRFVIGRNSYEVEWVNDIGKPGLLEIRMSVSNKNKVTDNFEQGVVTTPSTPSSGTLW